MVVAGCSQVVLGGRKMKLAGGAEPSLEQSSEEGVDETGRRKIMLGGA